MHPLSLSFHLTHFLIIAFFSSQCPSEDSEDGNDNMPRQEELDTEHESYDSVPRVFL